MARAGAGARVGGGHGGALELQGLSVEVAPLPARLSVAGGSGGLGAGGSIGGDGSPGLVRVESAAGAPSPDALAPSIEPWLPGDTQFNQPYASAAILSVGAWEPAHAAPDSTSASSSCWMQPDGPYYLLEFVADGPNPDDPLQKGWNMDLVYQATNGVELFPCRGLSSDPDFPLANLSFEDYFGNRIGDGATPPSLAAVRFQGARALGALAAPCAVDVSDEAGDIVAGSLTPFVAHPAELDRFEPRPDMVRFTVVLDRALLGSDPIAQNVLGITNLRIEVVPD